ncbi:MAG: YHS domain-containing protein [Gammaproteobacteria bacterium]|nr:YHS domain-containing protein [Gammaproteobacteria bacterium]
MLKHFRTALIAFAGLLVSSNVFAGADAIYTSLFSNASAGGYDVVAYFTESKPVKGKDDYQTEHKDADWYFSSQENLDAFIASPEKYAPQYGGYCAWAVFEGNLYKGDPQHWTVLNDKLYLNFDAEVQTQWNTNRELHISGADTNWPTVLENN